MKSVYHVIGTAGLAAALLLVPHATSQEVVVEKVVPVATVTGSITSFGDNRIAIRSEAALEPVVYSYSKDTTYIDETGTPVSIETVRSGLPVTVHYAKTDSGPLVTKIVVRRGTAVPSEITKTTTTTTLGTVSELTPDRLIVRSETATAPVRYSYTKTTTYVDEAGNPVSIKTVKSGLPVTVYYTKSGDEMVATKVVVRKAVAVPERTTETQTTTVMGTVREFTPADRIVIRTESSPDPVTYAFSKTTTYVDEAGQPVSAELVKTGLPVTIHYSTVGDARIADRVVIRKTTTRIK